MTETQDIRGAQTSTLRRGIQTKRQTNPLNPHYQYLGHIQDQDLADPRLVQTHTGNFSKGPLALSEKPHTPVASGNQKREIKPTSEVETGNEAHLFESYIPAVEQPAVKPCTPSHAVSAASNPKTPQSSTLPAVAKKSQVGSVSGDEHKPLHKRIDREEYMKDVQKFYGPGQQKAEEPSKISKLIEEIDNQKKVFEKLDRKQKNVLQNSKQENRRTAAQMIDKFIQTT